MIFDAHVHTFTPTVCSDKEVYHGDRHFFYLNGDPNAKIIGWESMLASMDESKIDKCISMGFPWYKEDFAQEQNLYFSELHKKSKKRIFPFGTVPINAKGDEEIWVKEIKKMGLFGIGEVGFYLEGLTNHNENFLRNLLSAAEKYQLPVNLHVNEPVGHVYPGKYDPEFVKLYNILKDFQKVTIIFAHWGGGLFFYELMPEVKEIFKNFYYDTAASPFLYDDKIYRVASEIIGSEKILFGSDGPLIKFSKYITAIKQKIKNKNDQQNIFELNANRIIGKKEK